MTLNSNKINLPKIVMIKFREIRCMMKREPLLIHIMLKQGFTWFSLASNTQETVQDNILFQNVLQPSTPVQLSIQDLQMSTTGRYHRCGNYSENDEGDPHLQKGPQQPNIIMQPIQVTSPSIPIPSEENGDIFERKKKYCRPFLSYLYLSQ